MKEVKKLEKSVKKAFIAYFKFKEAEEQIFEDVIPMLENVTEDMFITYQESGGFCLVKEMSGYVPYNIPIRNIIQWYSKKGSPLSDDDLETYGKFL